MKDTENEIRTGWTSWLAIVAFAVLLFEGVTGLAITFAPFSAMIEWSVLLHTLAGVVTLLPIAWYYAIHWKDYQHYTMSHVVLLGYVAVVALIVCVLSGLVVTWQGLFAVKMSAGWRNVHLISTFVTLGTALPHMIFPLWRLVRGRTAGPAWRFVWQGSLLAVLGLVALPLLGTYYSGTEYVNELPEDYVFLYGEDRPFAPSLARTESGGAYDPRSLSGSDSCGTAGCHEQILAEWKPSSHRYAAMDLAFQKVQTVMAEQNGAESTRYCGGCHDPISLFSGTKNIMVEDLTGLHGYQEGVSCLSCHSIRKTDLQGNANYVIGQPASYLWQWSEEGIRRVARDFLIRTYPDKHNELSKRAYKTPEYCAACHKQFIDQEVNQVGWVQLQNQYDNWKASRWYHEGDPERTIECRECHMPLVESNDPAAGDASDYNRSARDGKHRSHRFIAANGMMPALLKLEGWEKHAELTEIWLKGEQEIPEIADKWAKGPIVSLELKVPETVSPGDQIPIRVVLTSNKVGHDFPTGPLDIIQSWVEIVVTDDAGNTVFTSGTRDEKHFIEPGSFLFKVEPVDQFGNLIDRHNLWEMVGVRYRRSLFPGFSDTVDYTVDCPSGLMPAGGGAPAASDEGMATKEIDLPAVRVPGSYRITASLNYRKVDQYLLNFLFGEDSGLTAPVIRISGDTATVEVVPRSATAAPDNAGSSEAAGVGG